MKAAIRRNYGSPDQITVEQTETPQAKDGEVLIRVHASTVNRTDCANLTGKPFIMHIVLGLFRPRKIILGTDFAGEVVGIGKGVSSFNIGDRVYGLTDMGYESQAEFTTAPINNIFLIPDGIDYKHAAASLEGAHYAYTFIHKTKIKAGQSILINGATGGIGSALLQFVRQYDVRITATCNTKNIQLIQSLGADKTIDFTKDDFTSLNDKYDFIFDAVGKSTFGKCKPLLKENGVYISSELGPFAQNIFYPLLTTFSNKKVVFPIPYDACITTPYSRALLAAEKFMPVIDREYKLEDISKAYDYVLKGQKTGSVVVNIVD